MSHGFLPRRLPAFLISIGANRPKTVLAAYFAVLLAAALAIGSLKIQSDYLALVPEHNPVVDTFRSTLDRFGSIDLLLLAVVLPEEGDPDPGIAYADLLAEGLRESAGVAWVDYRLQDLAEAAAELVGRVTLFMDEPALEAFLDKFTAEGAEAAADRIAETVRSPLVLTQKQVLLRDPLNVAPLLLRQADLSGLGERFHQETGYLIDDRERLLLMLVKPVRPAADLAFDRQLLAELARVRTAATQAWHEDLWQGEPPALLVGGGYPIAAAEAALVTRDLIGGCLGALVAVVILFGFAFGRLAAVVLSAVPLLCGLALTFLFLVLALGQLNAATSAFAALLIGLGVDFIIVLYSRYLEERRLGADHGPALRACGQHTAVGVMLGAVTTAATFYAFLVSDFRGLFELGLLTGTGILLLVLTVFLLLPALLTLIEKHRPSPRFRLRAFGLQSLYDFSRRRPKTVIGACLLLTLLLGAHLFRVRYEDDILNMRSPQNPGVVAQNRIMETFGVRFTPIMVRVDGGDETELLTRTRSMLAQLNDLVERGVLARVDSPLALFPGRRDQLRAIRQLAERPIDTEAFEAAFVAALERKGVNPAPFLPGLVPMRAALKVQQPMSLSELAEGAFGHLLGRYLALAGETKSTIIYCYPPADKYRRQIPLELTRLAANIPGSAVTGPVALSIELKKIVWHDAMLAMILGTLVVLAFLIWDLGSIRAGLFALLPLLLGLTWTVGAMGLLELPVNFMNLFVFTMIIGIGVDYGIHLIHRRQEGGDVEGTVKAIVIAALTTVIGFGSLVFSHYPGLRSMGAVAMIGATSSGLISITLLPAIFSLRPGKERPELPR